MRKNKEFFSVFQNDEGTYFRFQDEKETLKEIKLAMIRPTHKQNQKAQEVYSCRWRELAEKGAPLRAQIPELLQNRKLWTDEMAAREKVLTEKIDKNWRKIKKGGIKLSDAQNLIKDCISAKGELIGLRVAQNQLDQSTAEALAEQERFNYLTAVCTVYAENNEPFFHSYEEFLLRDETGDISTTVAGEALWRLTTNLNEDFRHDWPEYQWLQKYKIVDEKLRFKRKDGKFVDFEGRLIDETGRFVDENGNFVDVNGKPVDQDGSPLEEFEPFLDDEGNPISV